MKKSYINKVTLALAALISAAMVLAGCGAAASNADAATTSAETSSTSDSEITKKITTETSEAEGSEEDETSSSAQEDVFSDRDLSGDYDEEEAIEITLNGTSATCDDTKAVSISGQNVTICQEGTYIISGTLKDGQIIVEVEDSEKVQLVLSGAEITSSSSAAIYVKSADKVFITLAANTQNTLENTGEFTQTDDSNVDAAVFSKDDLTINGSGELTVNSTDGGIVSKDDLKICGATLEIDCTGSALVGKDNLLMSSGTIVAESGTDGMKSTYDDTEDGEDAEKGFVTIYDGNITLNASDDGIHSTKDITIYAGSIQIESADDAIHAGANVNIYGGSFVISAGDDGVHADVDLQISDGTVQIDKSYEGLEGANILVSGGDVNITASDDGINAAGGNDSSGGGQGGWFGGMDIFGGSGDYSIVISGGKVVINATGDGVDSNGSLEITGGEVYVDGPVSDGDCAVDYQTSGTITGGTLIAVGSSGMAEGLSAGGEQGYILYTCSGQAGTTVSLLDSNGSELASWTAAKTFACVEISCPGLVQGETYTLKVGDAEYEITMDSTTYTAKTGGMGGMTGGRGGNMGGKGGNMGGGQGTVDPNSQSSDQGAIDPGSQGGTAPSGQSGVAPSGTPGGR